MLNNMNYIIKSKHFLFTIFVRTNNTRVASRITQSALCDPA